MMAITRLLRTYVVPLLFLALILIGWDLTKPRYPGPQFTHLVENTAPPAPPHNANEAIFKETRRRARESAASSLDQPWGSLCESDGRKRLVGNLKEYFYHRTVEERSYPARWGDAGRAYIAQEWSTADDKRIERLLRETYRRGYLDLREFQPLIAERIRHLLAGIEVRSKPCEP